MYYAANVGIIFISTKFFGQNFRIKMSQSEEESTAEAMDKGRHKCDSIMLKVWFKETKGMVQEDER